MFYFRYLCVTVLLGWQYAVSSPVAVTEYEYVREADAWLRLHMVPATWADAAVRCQLEGGVLASPTTSAMMDAILDTMAAHKLGLHRIFIGVTGLFSKGSFRSLDGKSLRSLEWALSELNFSSNDNCVALTGFGELATVGCARVLPYFCSKSVHNCSAAEEYSDNYYNYAVTNDVVGIFEPEAWRCDENGYEWEPRTGSCYKFHRAAETWRDALVQCHAEGGHLAIINSPTESAVLEELYEHNNHTVITGTTNPYYASIGFIKWDGEWMTLHGQTLDEAGFNQWSPGEPNGFGDENCGTIYWDGLLNDAPCDAPYPYICEKTSTEIIS